MIGILIVIVISISISTMVPRRNGWALAFGAFTGTISRAIEFHFLMLGAVLKHLAPNVV